jgi:hypothetical protein
MLMTFTRRKFCPTVIIVASHLLPEEHKAEGILWDMIVLHLLKCHYLSGSSF